MHQNTNLHQARVISNSWGTEAGGVSTSIKVGPLPCDHLNHVTSCRRTKHVTSCQRITHVTSCQDAIDFFNAANGGGFAVFAAGNSGSEVAEYPAAYKGAVSVAAVDNSGRRASFSSYGPTVDIAAPGVEILSTTTGGRCACIVDRCTWK